MDLDKLRYPIGKFELSLTLDAAMRQGMITNIKSYPDRLRDVVKTLTEVQLDTPYRPDGWTGRQVVHHLVDSHVNSYIRFRWTLTEDTPVIKAYNQKMWADLPDAKSAPVGLSLDLLEALHVRWSLLMEQMTSDDFDKELNHPEWKKNLSLNDMVQLYSWHCDHHLGHLTSLVKR